MLKNVRVFIIIILLSCTSGMYGQLTMPDFNMTNKSLIIIDTSSYFSNLLPYALDCNLMIAASKGYTSEIIRLIKKGADVNAETNEGATPLVFAITNNRPEAVKTLLKHNPVLEKVTRNFETPLLIAVKNNNSEITELLIRAGADIDFPDRHGVTPLHYASLYGFLDIVDLLLYYNAAIDETTDEGTTPLLTAVWAGNSDIADLLIQNGANTAVSDNDGFTPFLMASFYGDTLIMNLLYKKGVDIYTTDKSNYDALSLAISGGQSEAIEYLLKIGSKWTNSGRNTVDPYIVASKYRRKEIVNMLQKSKVPGHIKYGIDQVSMTASSRFFINDIYSGISFAFKEPYLNSGLIIGCDTKLWYTSVQTRDSARYYHQYYDKGAVAYAGLFKEFTIRDNPAKFSYSFSTALLAGYSFGNRLKGTMIAPENKFKIIPSVSFKITKMNFSLNLGMEYINTEYYHNGPVWFRLGCSYNYFFDNVRMKTKTLDWN